MAMKKKPRAAASAAPAAAIADAATQEFTAVFAIRASGVEAAAGDTVELSREEFDELKALGAIDGDWKDEPAA